MMLGRILECATQAEDRQRTRERFLGGAEALADDVAKFMVDDVILGRDDLRESLHALSFRHGGLDEEDRRTRCEYMRPLDVQRRFPGPTEHVAVGRIERRHLTGGLDDRQAWRIRQAELLIEALESVLSRRRAEAIDDDDRLTAAVDPGRVQRRQVVRLRELGGLIAMNPEVRQTIGCGWRERQVRDGAA